MEARWCGKENVFDRSVGSREREGVRELAAAVRNRKRNQGNKVFFDHGMVVEKPMYLYLITSN